MRNTVATTVWIGRRLGNDGAPTCLMIDIDMVFPMAATARSVFSAAIATAIAQSVSIEPKTINRDRTDICIFDYCQLNLINWIKWHQNTWTKCQLNNWTNSQGNFQIVAFFSYFSDRSSKLDYNVTFHGTKWIGATFTMTRWKVTTINLQSKVNIDLRRRKALNIY